MLKAFGYSERVVNSDVFFRKRPILHHTCATCSELPSFISKTGLTDKEIKERERRKRIINKKR